MKINKIHIDGQTFLLDTGEDVEDLKTRIVAAASGGAAFVDFETVGRGVISALITPSMGVRFEVIDRTRDQMLDWETNPPVINDNQSLEVDRYYEHYGE